MSNIAGKAYAMNVVTPSKPYLTWINRLIFMVSRGLPSTLGGELDCNPFLRIDAPAVRAAVTAREPGAADDRVAAFAGLRRWKDGFRA